MGTKNNPSKFDCYANAKPDEPMFILLGRDPAAAMAIVVWVKIRLEMGATVEDEHIAEARECARTMEDYCKKIGKDPNVGLEAFKRALESFNTRT